MGHRFKMTRSHAQRVTAKMVDLQSLRDRADEHLIGEPVGRLLVEVSVPNV
jgi:hypothetical protein